MEHNTIAADAATESRARFTCEPRALADAVALLAMRLIEKRVRVPIASCLMIEARPDGTLHLQGTDFTLQATVTIAADVETPGAFCTDAANLKAMLAKLKKVDRDALRIEDQGEGRAVLVIGRNRFNLPTLPVDDFPRLNAPTCDTEGEGTLSRFTVSRDQLVRDLAALALCVATDGSRYYLEGIAMQVRTMAGRQRLVMVATNGTEIGIASRELPASADSLADCILPRKAVALIGHAAKLAPTDEIEVQHADKFAFTIGNVEIIAKSIDGTFPQWERVFDDQLAPTDEIECGALFPDLLPGNGVPVAKLDKLAKAAGEIEWSDAAKGKTGAVVADPDMLFGVMGLATSNEPVKGFHYSTAQDRDDAFRYLKALATTLHGKEPTGEQTAFIVEGDTYCGITVGKARWKEGTGCYVERPNFETLTMEQVFVEPERVYEDGAYSVPMPAERATVRQDYAVSVEGDREYPIAVNSGATKIHLSAAQVRELCGEGTFETLSFEIGGKVHHVSKWLWDDGATRLGTVQPDGRTFPHYHKKGFDYSSDSVSFTRDEIEAAMRGEIVEPEAMPEIVATTAQDSESELEAAQSAPEPVEALESPQNGSREPVSNPDELQGECMAAFIETLEPLPAQSAATPTAHIKRSPAHERAIRRAWKERSLRRSAAKAANMHYADAKAARAERNESVQEARKYQAWWEGISRDAAALCAERDVLAYKRRRSTILARDLQKRLNAEHHLVDRANERRIKAEQERDAARQTPTYFDEVGIERRDAATVAFQQGRHAIDKAEGLERRLSEANAKVERQQRAIEGLSAEYEAMAKRALKAERDMAAVEARLNGWPPAVRTVGVNFALAG